jgi:hypothetical protein
MSDAGCFGYEAFHDPMLEEYSMENRFIGTEEEMMETTFGEQYRDYKQRVRK